jgi:hypothetical protein
MTKTNVNSHFVNLAIGLLLFYQTDQKVIIVIIVKKRIFT